MGTLRLGNSVVVPSVINTLSGNDYYIEKTLDTNNTLIGTGNIIDLSGVTDIGAYALAYAYYYNTQIPTTLNNVFPNLIGISNTNACYRMFGHCSNILSFSFPSSLISISGHGACQEMFSYTGLTTVSIPGLKTIRGEESCYTMFGYCSYLSSVDLSSLETISGMRSCSEMFRNCTGLTNIGLSKLTSIDGAYSCYGMFGYCSSLSSVDLSSLETIIGNYACFDMFRSTGLSNVSFTKLKTIVGSYSFVQMFYNCTNLTSLSFPAAVSSTFPTDNVFTGMLSGCSNVTVHFPSNLQSVIGNWSNIQNGLGGTNTTVLFDLPATE